MSDENQNQQSGEQNDNPPPPPSIRQELVTNAEKGNHATKIIKKD
jgi:hypothetical protein